MHDTTAKRPQQELAHRSGDGIEVTMFWTPGDNVLTVRLVDFRVGECFEFPVGRDRGNYAFKHPFAYAAEQQR